MITPRNLLILDAIGAAVTALATYYLLAGERLKTGLPVELCYALAAIALAFSFFDIAALYARIDPSIALRIIACANVSYCILVVALLTINRATVTQLGLAYFCIEAAVVLSLAVLEWKVASRPSPS